MELNHNQRKNQPGILKLGQIRSALFLHTQKTAGTTVIDEARAHYGTENVMSHGDFLSVDPDRFDKAPFISGHFGFDFAKKRADRRYCFTFLRDPIERLVSLYSFCRSQNTDAYPIYAVARRSSLENFLLGWRGLSGIDRLVYLETIFNTQTWQLCSGWTRDVMNYRRKSVLNISNEQLKAQALSNLHAFDYVGFVETFGEDWRHIAADLGFASVDPNRKSNTSENRLRLEDVPASTIDVLQSMTELDREIYQIEWDRRRSARRPSGDLPNAAA